MDHDEKQKESDEDLLKRRFLKESPFNTINGNFRYTACVGTNGGYDQSTIYNGFKDAVDTLIESIGDNRTQADAMVYPILYCIRHCIELFLKSSYQSIQYINCLKCNHDSYNKLKKLWKISLKTSRQQEDCEWLIKNSDEEVDATRLEKAQSRYETLKNRFDRISECINYDINPISEAKYVIAGMKKCGQMTYASTIENYISQLNAQQSSLSEVKSD